jgi:hypothetical protein
MQEPGAQVQEKGAAPPVGDAAPRIPRIFSADHGDHTTETPFVMLRNVPHGPAAFRYAVW